MHSRVFVGTALLLLAIVAPNSAQADPIVITAGTIVQPGGTSSIPGSGNIVGTENFTWVGEIDPTASFGAQCDLRCAPGAIVNVGGVLGTTNVKGEVTYQDQQFRVGGTPASFGVLNFNFLTESLELPPAGPSAVFTAPFTVTGGLTFPFFGPPAQPSVPLSGAGIVTAFFIPSPSAPGVAPGWQLSQLSYEFAAEPVPEPSTMLLVGGGMAALLRRRWRLKRTS